MSTFIFAKPGLTAAGSIISWYFPPTKVLSNFTINAGRCRTKLQLACQHDSLQGGRRLYGWQCMVPFRFYFCSMMGLTIGLPGHVQLCCTSFGADPRTLRATAMDALLQALRWVNLDHSPGHSREDSQPIWWDWAVRLWAMLHKPQVRPTLEFEPM